METTNKINIFIADDEPNEVKKILDVLNSDGSVLKGHFTSTSAYFANSIPEGYEIYSEIDIATNVIRNAKQIDLALVDLVFKEEFDSTSMEGAEIIIQNLQRKFPNCPVGILSNNAGGIFLNTKISISGRDYPCIAKKPGKISIDTYNTFFKNLLSIWLRNKLSLIDRENKVNELLGLLANPQKSFESTLSLADEKWLLSDLFFFISKDDKEPIQKFIFEYLVTMPRLRKLRNPEKDLIFYKNTTIIWSISFSDLFNSYYSFFSHLPKNSFSKLAEDSKSFTLDLLKALCISEKQDPEIKSILAGVSRMSNTAIRNQKLDERGVMPHCVVSLFREKLVKRMIALNLYCFLGFSATGINFILNKNNDALSDNHTKGISKFLGIGIPDQISTQVDKLIHSFAETDRRRKDRKPNLNLLDRLDRQYDFQFKYCGSYEKKHLISMLDSIKKTTCDDKNCTICRITIKNIDFVSKNQMLLPDNYK